MKEDVRGAKAEAGKKLEESCSSATSAITA
jgi:hypothetical protein